MCATITILVNLWRTSCEHPNIDMHTNPCANMETHWPVHLKRDTRPTHFEREAGQYGPSVSRPIRSEMRRPRFAGTLRACKCTLSAGRSEREYMTESCPKLHMNIGKAIVPPKEGTASRATPIQVWSTESA